MDRRGHHTPTRFPTRVVRVGNLEIGGASPILIQSMTIADTGDTEAVVAEIRELVEAGCPLVRVTVPSQREAENLREIKGRLRADGVDVPLVADIHFTPNAALVAAEIVEKVRINPGNYADRKKFAVFEISDAEYAFELERIRERFLPLVKRLKDHGTALRIGTNHGSLSDRIMNRYGDTPEGMVESALEFARICGDERYHDIVFSMKSSIPSVMIAAYRLLVQRMVEEGMDYPIHLGVTEAGDGIEGRIKSAVGIGSLLASGIGDTIRVSLTEDSRHEIAAARNILEALAIERGGSDTSGSEKEISPGESAGGVGWQSLPVQSLRVRRATGEWGAGSGRLGGTEPLRVELPVTVLADGGAGCRVQGESGEDLDRILATRDDSEPVEIVSATLDPSISSSPDDLSRVLPEVIVRIRDRIDPAPMVVLEWPGSELPGADVIDVAREHVSAISLIIPADPAEREIRAFAGILSSRRLDVRWWVPVDASPDDARRISAWCREAGMTGVGFACVPGPGWIARTRDLAHTLADSWDPIFLMVPAQGASMPMLAGALLCDGIGDAIALVEGDGLDRASADPWPEGGVGWEADPVRDAYRLLQACRVRLTRAEFIACPSCGRTQFDLQTTTARIRRRTAHLKGIKIAIMGCIVNGPGEMADADFGYVGSGKGKIDLYVGKDRVARNIPESEAEDRLVALITDHDRWVDAPETPEDVTS